MSYESIPSYFNDLIGAIRGLLIHYDVSIDHNDGTDQSVPRLDTKSLAESFPDVLRQQSVYVCKSVKNSLDPATWSWDPGDGEIIKINRDDINSSGSIEKEFSGQGTIGTGFRVAYCYLVIHYKNGNKGYVYSDQMWGNIDSDSGKIKFPGLQINVDNSSTGSRLSVLNLLEISLTSDASGKFHLVFNTGLRSSFLNSIDNVQGEIFIPYVPGRT